MLLAPPCPARPDDLVSAVRPVDTHRARRRLKARVLPALMWLAVLLGLGLLVAELRTSDPGAMLRTLHIGWLAAALACTALSLFAAAQNLHGFATVSLRTASTLRAQLAVGFTRILMPSAVSNPAVASRYLNRSGASWSAAVATVSAAQVTQLIVTTVIVAVLSLASPGSHHGLVSVAPQTLAVIAVSVGVAAGLAAVTARRNLAVRRALRGAAASWLSLRRHAREYPGRIAKGVLAAAVLTCAHLMAFACCVYAVGGHGTLLAFTVVYLASSAAGSLFPTPGGAGAVETALIAGLTATGLPLPVAAAAALLSRLESVWLPAVPGWWALRSMRRDGLL